MRTSRIARETTKLINALTPRQLRGRAPREPNGTSSAVAQSSDSVATNGAVTASPGRKRKREHSISDNADASSNEAETKPVDIKLETQEHITTGETTVTRTSPRKAAASNGASTKRAKRQPAKRVVGTDGAVRIEPPPNWEAVYAATQEMRSQVLAPVDTMGCESLAEEHRSPRDQRLQTLVALMLSSQTKDTVTSVAMKNLQDGLPGGFNLEALLSVDPPTLNGLISKVGFHNNKTKFIKQAAVILRDKYHGDIPDTIEGLVSLPGVGPKMAYLCMSAAWGRDEGIGVDVHVHRITNLWGWHKTQTPEQTREALEAWLPRDKWHDINHLLVGFGQTWCPPVGRKCGECRLAELALCPSAVVAKTSTVKKVKKVKTLASNGDGDDAPVKNEQTEVQIVTSEVKAEDLDDPNAFLDSKKVADMSIDMEDIGRKSRQRRR